MVDSDCEAYQDGLAALFAVGSVVEGQSHFLLQDQQGCTVSHLRIVGQAGTAEAYSQDVVEAAQALWVGQEAESLTDHDDDLAQAEDETALCLAKNC